jgi:hypothetical protein
VNVGSVWTAVSWVIKYFIVTPFDAFLAHALYRVSRAAAGVPFQTFFYEKAIGKGREVDEFIVNREMLINIGRFLFLLVAAGVFFFFPSLPLNGMFVLAAVFALGFMFMGKPPAFLSLKNNQ